jgi:putative phosphoribosyl transferase
MFRDRADAGRRLAAVLMKYRGESVGVFALPRGGVVLGVEIARYLQAPLDLIVVRKIGHPQSPEYAIGAVTEDGDVVLNRQEAETLDPAWIATTAEAELREARRRRSIFLPDRPPISAEGKIAIIVDDGVATGLTMEAGIHQLRKQHPLKVVVAVPVAAAGTVKRLSPEVDEIVVLHEPTEFGAVGAFYSDFGQLSDGEVIALVKSSPGIQ